MKHNSSILIPDGEGDLAIKVLRCLSCVPGLRVSVLSRDYWSLLRFSRHTARFFNHEVDDFDKRRLDLILETAKKVKADVIMPISQPTIRLMAEYRHEIESVAALPPIPTPEFMDIAADKWLLSEILRKENIPFPTTILCQRDKLNEQDLARLTYPVLIKPRDGRGGTGIMFFNSHSELIEYSEKQDYYEKFIVQEFIEGYDLGCSVLCQKGEILAYTMQKGVIPERSALSLLQGLPKGKVI